jgi:hypothetical protein
MLLESPRPIPWVHEAQTLFILILGVFFAFSSVLTFALVVQSQQWVRWWHPSTATPELIVLIVTCLHGKKGKKLLSRLWRSHASYDFVRSWSSNAGLVTMLRTKGELVQHGRGEEDGASRKSICVTAGSGSWTRHFLWNTIFPSEEWLWYSQLGIWQTFYKTNKVSLELQRK